MASTGLQAASWLAQSRLAVSYLKWGFDTVFRLIMNPIYLLTPVQDFLVWEGWAGLGWMAGLAQYDFLWIFTSASRDP